MTFKRSSATTKNHVLFLPLELVLAVMDQLDSIYTLKALLEAFPDELLPLFKTYSKSILNTIFWRPVRHYSDENGVVYRWMIRELKLEYLFEPSKGVEGKGVDSSVATVGSGKGDLFQGAQIGYERDLREGLRRKARDRFIFSDGNDVD